MDSMNLNFLFRERKKKLPLVLQDERAECGHACVAMISNYWGHELDLYTLRKIKSTSSKGSTLSELISLFETLGFSSTALQVPLEEMHLIKTPAILHWNLNHFVVLKKVSKNYIVIHDPATGARRYTWREVSQSFTGIILEVNKSEDFQKIRDKNKLSLFSLLKTITGINQFIVFLLVLSLALEVFTLINPLFIQYVTDNVVDMNEKSNLYAIAFGFLILTFIQAFTEYTRGNMVIYISKNLTEQFSSNIVRHLLKLPLDFFEKRSKGDLHTKFQGIQEIQKKLSTDFISTSLNGLMIIINFLVMLLYSTLLSSFVFLFLMVTLFIRYSSYQYVKKQSEASIHYHTKSLTLFLETLHAILPIKTFLKERLRFSLWRGFFIKSLNADIKIEKFQALAQVSDEFLSQIEYILVVCLGASLVISNQFSVGMLIAFLSYRLLFVNKMHAFIRSMMEYKLISIQLQRLSDIVLQSPEVITKGCGQKDKTHGSLHLKNISFKYQTNEPWVLRKINLRIHAGEKVAIVGPSGCGKSTLLKIIMGLLVPQEGEIYIDHYPLTTFGLENYRQLTAAVMQEDLLLSGSIIQNIVFFDEHIDFEKVYSATQIACIHDFISSLPMGYETLIGEMGSNFSGGQKQRILLARALYRQPKILFLDEATSHLDRENEHKISESLRQLQITQIIIAHRQETIEKADSVISLAKINNL